MMRHFNFLDLRSRLLLKARSMVMTFTTSVNPQSTEQFHVRRVLADLSKIGLPIFFARLPELLSFNATAIFVLHFGDEDEIAASALFYVWKLFSVPPAYINLALNSQIPQLNYSIQKIVNDGTLLPALFFSPHLLSFWPHLKINVFPAYLLPLSLL